MHSSNTTLAKNAYGQSSTAVRTERSIEYQVFATATNLLAKAQTQTNYNSAVAEALDYNRKLWNVLADDVDNDNNQLPVSLRAQIMSLALYVKKHTRGVIAGTHSIDALIDINTTIMRGLREERV